MVKAKEINIADLPRHELKWRSVPLSEVISAGTRLEASVYNAQSKRALETVKKCGYGYVPFSKLVDNAYYPGRFRRTYTAPPYGVPFYLPSQLTDVYPQAEKYISRLTKCNIDDLRLKRGDVLLTRSGTIGSISLVSKTLENTVFSDDVIRITAKEGISGYLYAFFRSSIGNILLQTNNYGAVIQHIEPEHLSGIPVPNPPAAIKSRINGLILRSFELRDESNVLIDEATAMLVKELKLPTINEFQADSSDGGVSVNTYSVKLSELAGRLDGSYHLPSVKSVTTYLCANAAAVTTIKDKRVSKDIILPGRFKRVYVGEGQGRVFIGGKQIYELDPCGKKYLSLIHHSGRIKEQLELFENMTLITCSGSIGKVTLVPRHWNNWAASQHIIRVVPANLDIAGYLAIFLASDFGRLLITRFTYGSVVDEIDDVHVSQIPFPLLKDTTAQAEINRLALKANELRYNAYILEQEAMSVLENDVFTA